MILPKLNFKHIDLEENRRILVTSDIHGNLNYFQKALEKAGFCGDDILFIVGDIIEKGTNSLSTLRYVIQLHESGNAIPLIGNVDAWRLHMINEISKDSIDDFYSYLLTMRGWCGTSIFDEMAKELGRTVECPKDILELKELVISHFRNELEFLAGLPTVVETQDYVFVHGGLRDKDIKDNLNRDLFELAKYDEFINTEHHFDKYVVVGHWPVALYDDKILQHNPIINRDKKIISIDGGCGLKKDGQLNLFVLPSTCCDISDAFTISYDDFPVFTALDNQEESRDSFHIRWIDNKINIIEEKDDLTYVEHVSTGRKMWVLSEYITENQTCNEDFTYYELPVKKGDKLSVIKKTSRGYFAKKNGVVGWYYGRLEEVK